MIRGWIAGYGRPSKETRHGDTQVLIDDKNKICFIIDGGCDDCVTALISYLKRNGIKKVYLLLSHPHYDHADGLRKIIKDNYFTVLAFYCYDPNSLKSGLRNNKGSKAVREDIDYLNKIISEAKAKKVPVKFLKHGDKVELGDIKFKVYRKQPSRVEDDDENGWSYVNDGSLCCYFYEWYYWTSGDGSERVWDFIEEMDAKENSDSKGKFRVKVKFFKIPHHGNNCPRSQANGLKENGADYCWYNDLEPNGVGTTDFTEFGANRCKQAGIKVFESVGDINFIIGNGKFIIYKDGKEYRFTVPYKGTFTFKTTNIVDVVRDVFMDKYGTSNTRTTKLLDAKYSPTIIQKQINLVVNTAKKIINRKVNYGNNEQRIKNLDKAFGAGYGQLIQDEINSLLNAKSKKW